MTVTPHGPPFDPNHGVTFVVTVGLDAPLNVCTDVGLVANAPQQVLYIGPRGVSGAESRAASRVSAAEGPVSYHEATIAADADAAGGGGEIPGRRAPRCRRRSNPRRPKQWPSAASPNLGVRERTRAAGRLRALRRPVLRRAGVRASADFALDKPAGSPARTCAHDFRCGIHAGCATAGFRGCTVYDCFGAGQRVTRRRPTQGPDWRQDAGCRPQMFAAFG